MIEIKSDKIDTSLLINRVEENIIEHEKTLQKKEIERPKVHTIEKNSYHIDEFWQYEDREFVQNIYSKILQREADTPSLEYHLALLRSGEKSKSQLLTGIRYSKEAREKNIQIQGIQKHLFLALLYKIPLLSYFIKLIVALLKTPKILQKLQKIEALQEQKNIFQREEQQKQEEEQQKQEEEQQKQEQKQMKLLDTLYIEFENHFRGEKAVIKERQSYYIPYVQTILQDKTNTLLDIGCGRGEWLELLQENNFIASGVDLNGEMVEEAKASHLDVKLQDAISYLKTQADESLGVITAFHIVEHLPLTTLIELFDESLRVLKQGGMIIYETPNPENLLVGSCSFYTDPTHKNPIPPATLQFLAQNRGFKEVALHRLAKRKEPLYLEGENQEDINELIFRSTCEQDYSIIGYKL